jgi:hypothetical protein
MVFNAGRIFASELLIFLADPGILFAYSNIDNFIGLFPV